MAKYVMALDAGTTSNRCILFNEKRGNRKLCPEGVYPVFSKAGLGGTRCKRNLVQPAGRCCGGNAKSRCRG